LHINIIDKLRPEQEETFQNILTKPIEINYLLSLLAYIIKGLDFIPISSTNLFLRTPTEIPSKITDVLLVDDNDFCRKALERLLNQFKNLALTRCINGKEALERYTKTPRRNYEFVFIDYQMPEMDGITLIKKIREYEKAQMKSNNPKLICNIIRITIFKIVLSGDTDKETEILAKEAGANFICIAY